MTSSFHKIYGLAVHTKTQGCHFQINSLWDPVSNANPIQFFFAYTAKCVSVWMGPNLSHYRPGPVFMKNLSAKSCS